MPSQSHHLLPFLLLLCSSVLVASSDAQADSTCRDVEKSTCSTACAQEASSSRQTCENRCLDARCGPDSWSLDGSAPVTDAQAANKKPCNEDQRAQCAETCRREFGNKFKECNSNCLGAICDPNPTESEGSSSDSNLTCIEFESQGCVEKCKDHSGQQQFRCRRGCLSDSCPGSSQSDMMKESMDPGRLRCDRCREEHRATCKQQCYYGIGVGQVYSKGQYAGHLGCEQFCMSSVCSKSCPNPIPNPF